MAAFSSKNGNAKWDSVDIPHSRGWTINLVSDVKPYASSDTAGHMRRIPGHTDWTAQVTFYQDAATDIEGVIREGDVGTLDLFEDGTRKWSGPGVVESIEINGEIEGGELVQGTITIGADGAITAPT